jgi:hypothetical protein
VAGDGADGAQDGLRSNATMLYGHVENDEDRVDHLLRLRAVQDETGGFQTFIPLAFHPDNTALAHISEVDRDAGPEADCGGAAAAGQLSHIKSYWQMVTPKMAQISLRFGADDIDGTVIEEKIYHDAGATTPQGMRRADLVRLITEAGRVPFERDTLYRAVTRSEDNEQVELATPYGPMRTYIFRPAAAGKYPGIIFYSEIFQITGPIRRTAAMLAGHGYIVAVPEIYHEFEAAGTVLAYDQAGADRGNVLKTQKELASYDADARAVLDYLKARPDCTGRLGAMGICIGGHLAFRAAMNADVRGTVSVFMRPTFIKAVWAKA